MARVILHGSLKKFGGPFDIGAQTAGEAIRALCIMVPGFRQAVAEGDWHVIRGKRRGGIRLGIEEIGIGLGGRTELHIAPAVAGAGGRGSGATKVIIGIALIAAVVLTAGAAGPGAIAAGAIAGTTTGATTAFGAGLASISVLGFSGSQIALFGAALLLTGVSQLISPQPKAATSSEPADQKTSYLFSGVTNQIEPGGPVPLLFGRAMIGSIVVSSGLDVKAISGGGGTIEVTSALVGGVL